MQTPPKNKPAKKMAAKKTVTKKTYAKKIDTVKKSVPSSTDSVAVYMRNSDKRSNWSDVAKAAEKKYGKIDVSKLDIGKDRTINAAQARKKYNLK